MKIGMIAVAALALIAAWNWMQFKALQNPSAAVIEKVASEHALHTPGATGANADSALELSWTLMEKIRLASATLQSPEFPPELQALNGKYVHMAGVFSPLDQLKSKDSYLGGVLQPPSKLACCGLTCDLRTQLLVFVDCSGQPWTQGQSKALISIIGKLELSADNTGWGNASLTDARMVLLKK